MITVNPHVGDDRLEEVLADYLACEAAGQRPDRHVLLARHPELADDLQAFFRRQDWMGRLLGKTGTRNSSTSAEPPQTESFAGERRRDRLNTTSPSHLGEFGQYELLEEVARGGMGVIYRARHASLNRIVALKMILANRLAGAEDVKRFYIEARAAAQLDHPGIVPIYEVGQVAEQHYYSMAFVEGRSLQAVLTTVGVVDPRSAAELVRRVAEAMAYAHGRGIFHRDLKPANILLAEGKRSDAVALALPEGTMYCEPRVTDFGLAKRAENEVELTGTGQILGTPGYMPPEQARGDTSAVGSRSDVYSLGAVLYCLVTGRPPFRAADAIQTLKQVIEDETVPPRRVNSAVPRDLETICLKCLEKDQGRRYDTAQGLADDLERFLDGKPITARPVGSLERARKSIRRHPARAALAVAALVMLMAGVGLVVSQQYQAKLTRGLYFRNVVNAHTAWRENNFIEARHLLDQCPQHLRGWEWDYVDRLCHLGYVSTIKPSSSRESRGLRSAGGSDSIYVFDAALTRVEAKFEEAQLQVFGVKFTADGEQLDMASVEGDIRRWDLRTNQIVSTQASPDVVLPRITYSPDGRYVACRPTATFYNDTTRSNRKYRDGLRNLSAGFFGDPALGHAARVAEEVVPASPGAYLVAGTVGPTETPNFQKLAEAVSKEHSGNLFFTEIDPTGQRLASSGDDGTIKLWDVRTCRHILDCEGHPGPVNDLAFSADGRRLASGGHDRTVRIWEVLTGRLLLALGGPDGHTRAVSGVAFHPSGGQVASTGADLAIKIWNVGSGSEAEILPGHSGPARCVAFHPAAKRLASAGTDGILKVWQFESRTLVHEFQAHDKPIAALAFSPDGRQLASAGEDRTVKIWNASSADSQPLQVLKVHQGNIYGLSFSPDGRQLASAGHDGNCLIWDLSNGQVQQKLHRTAGPVRSIAFDLKGRCLAMGGNDVAVQNLQRNSEVLLPAGEPVVLSVAFSPDGARLATGGRDGKLHMWRAATGSRIGSIAAHRAPLTCVAFSPAGDRVATTSLDGSIKVWDPNSLEQETLSLKGQGGRAYCVAFSPDGRYLASANHDGTITLWGK